MDIFIQQIINGLVLGSIYALVALGYTPAQATEAVNRLPAGVTDEQERIVDALNTVGLTERADVQAAAHLPRGLNGAAPWDSLNIMQAVVLIDEVYGNVVHGRALQDCATVADILKVAEGQ